MKDGSSMPNNIAKIMKASKGKKQKHAKQLGSTPGNMK